MSTTGTTTLGDTRVVSSPEPDGPQSVTRRLFRGASDQELIPRIQAELGTDAIVLARRSGLTGGVAGFFQRPFVEIEAEAGHPGIDLYDGEPAGNLPAEPTSGEWASPRSADESPWREPSGPAGEETLSASEADLAESFRELLPASFVPELLAGADGRPVAAEATPGGESFAAMLASVPEPSAVASESLATMPSQQPATIAPVAQETAVDRLPVSEVEAEPLPCSPRARPRTKLRATLEESLLQTGMSEAFAGRLVDGAAAHLVPLHPRAGLATAVRRAIEAHIPVRPPLPAGGGTIVLVGPGGSGKTGCCESFVDAYERGGGLSADLATIIGGSGRGGLELLLRPGIETPISVSAPRAVQALKSAGGTGMTIIDTPALSPGDRGAIRELGALLGRLSPEQILVALPATLGARAAGQLLEALRPLAATALAITHADETDQLGVAVEAACQFGLAPEFVVERSRGRMRLARVTPAELTERLLG